MICTRLRPGPLERTCWRRFAAQWGDCKKSRIGPLNAIIIIKYYHYYCYHHHNHHHHQCLTFKILCTVYFPPPKLGTQISVHGWKWSLNERSAVFAHNLSLLWGRYPMTVQIDVYPPPPPPIPPPPPPPLPPPSPRPTQHMHCVQRWLDWVNGCLAKWHPSYRISRSLGANRCMTVSRCWSFARTRLHIPLPK